MLTLEPGKRETRISRLIAPRPVALIVTVSADGVPNMAPFSFFTPVSYSPPTVCFSCGIKKHEVTWGYDPQVHPEPADAVKDTLVNIRATGEFVVNLVTVELLEAVSIADRRWPYGINEVKKANLTEVKAHRVRVPLIGEAKIAMECRTVKMVEVADSVVVFGEVLLVHVAPEVLQDGKVDAVRAQPVMHSEDESFWRVGEGITVPRDRYGI